LELKKKKSKQDERAISIFQFVTAPLLQTFKSSSQSIDALFIEVTATGRVFHA
jgi:hypothetical protein